MGVLPALERRFVACATPDVQTLYVLRVLAHVVENTIWTNHDFGQRTSRSWGGSWSNVWKVGKNLNVGKYVAPGSRRCLQIMLNDRKAMVNNAARAPNPFLRRV